MSEESKTGLSEEKRRKELTSAAWSCIVVAVILLILLAIFAPVFYNFQNITYLFVLPVLLLAGGIGLWFRQEWVRRFLDVLLLLLLLGDGVSLGLLAPMLPGLLFSPFGLFVVFVQAIMVWGFVSFRTDLWKDGVVQECRKTDALQGPAIKRRRLIESIGVLVIGVVTGIIIIFQ